MLGMRGDDDEHPASNSASSHCQFRASYRNEFGAEQTYKEV